MLVHTILVVICHQCRPSISLLLVHELLRLGNAGPHQHLPRGNPPLHSILVKLDGDLKFVRACMLRNACVPRFRRFFLKFFFALCPFSSNLMLIDLHSPPYKH